jgi:hypothetical protein
VSEADQEGIMERNRPVSCYFSLSGEPSIGSKVQMEIAFPGLRGAEDSTVRCEGTIVAVSKARKGKTGLSCTIDKLNLESAAND